MAKPQLTCDSADKGTMGGERKTSGLLGDNLREALQHRRSVRGPWDCDSAPSAGDHCPGAGASPTLSSPQKEGAGKGCQSPLVTMRITSPGRLRESKPARSSSQGCATWGERLPLPGPHFSPQLHESPQVQMTNEGQSNCPLKFSKTYA